MPLHTISSLSTQGLSLLTNSFFWTFYMILNDDHISTSIYHKDTDSHSHLNFAVQIIHWYLIASSYACARYAVMKMISTTKPKPWRHFMHHAATSPPPLPDLIRRVRRRAETKHRGYLLATILGNIKLHCSRQTSPSHHIPSQEYHWLQYPIAKLYLSQRLHSTKYLKEGHFPLQ